MNVTFCVPAVQCAYSVRVDAVVTLSPSVTCVPPFAAVHHPENFHPACVTAGKLPYVPPTVYVCVCVSGVPPFPLNVTVCVPAVQCAYSVRDATAGTVLSAVTSTPPLSNVHHPAKSNPSFEGVGRLPYGRPIVYDKTFVSGVPPFPLNVTFCTEGGSSVQCAYSVLDNADDTLSPSTTCVPPFASVHHPSNTWPSHSTSANIPYLPPMVYCFFWVSGVPPFPSNVTVWLVVSPVSGGRSG